MNLAMMGLEDVGIPLPHSCQMFKVNTNVTVDMRGGTSTLGMINKDAQGLVHLSSMSKYFIRFLICIPKLKLFLFALKLAFGYGFHSIIIESDSLLAISETDALDVSCKDEAYLILDVDLISSGIECCFVHIKRGANQLVYKLIN